MKACFSTFIILLILILIFTSCKKSEFNQEIDPLEHNQSAQTESLDEKEPEQKEELDTIDLVFQGYSKEGKPNNAALIAKMMDAVNEKLIQDLNAQIHFVWLSYDDYANNVLQMLAAKAGADAVDISYIGSEVYTALIDADLLYDIKDDFKIYMPDTYKLIYDTFDNADELLMDDGKQYFIPTVSAYPVRDYIAIPKDLYEQYPNKITTFEDYEEYMQWIKENRPEYTPCYLNPIDVLSMYLKGHGYYENTVTTFYASMYDPEKPSVPMEEVTEFMDVYEMLKRWNERGYKGQTSDDGYIYFALQGKLASILYNSNAFSRSQTIQLPAEIDYEYIVLYPDTKMLRAPDMNGLSLLKSADSPEKTLQFIELVYTDSQYYDLIQYGIEGVNYKKVDGKITVPDAPQNAILNWWGSENFCNYTIERSLWSEPEDYAEFFFAIAFDNTTSESQMYENHGLKVKSYIDDEKALEEHMNRFNNELLPLLDIRFAARDRFYQNLVNWNFEMNIEQVIDMLHEANADEITEVLNVINDNRFE